MTEHSLVALQHQLAPLKPFLEMDGVTEICINRPKEVYVEKNSVFSRYEVEELNSGSLKFLVSLIAEFNHKAFPAPFVSGKLPTGERVQFVMEPASEKGLIVGSIRRHHMRKMTLDDYIRARAFEDIIEEGRDRNPFDDQLKELYKGKDISMRHGRPKAESKSLR